VEARILVIDDGLDSWNLLSSILRTHRYQPIWAADGIQALSIVVTAQDPAVAEQKARECGAVAFLQKPLKADELIATIQGVLGKQE